MSDEQALPDPNDPENVTEYDPNDTDTYPPSEQPEPKTVLTDVEGEQTTEGGQANEGEQT